MPERFKVVCIPYKALYKCSAFTSQTSKTITRMNNNNTAGNYNNSITFNNVYHTAATILTIRQF